MYRVFGNFQSASIPAASKHDDTDYHSSGSNTEAETSDDDMDCNQY